MFAEVKVGNVKLDLFQVLEIRVAMKKHVESMQEQLDTMLRLCVDQKIIDSHIEWMNNAKRAAEAFESVTPC